MNANPVVGWLQSAGLEHYVPAFEVLSEEAFLKLLMQDYGKFGVTDMDDKQKLFRLIKSVSHERRDGNASAPGSSSRERGQGMGMAPYGPAASGGGSFGGVLDHHVDGSGGLLDLEADDGDLLMTVRALRRGGGWNGALGSDGLGSDAGSDSERSAGLWCPLDAVWRRGAPSRSVHPRRAACLGVGEPRGAAERRVGSGRVQRRSHATESPKLCSGRR